MRLSNWRRRVCRLERKVKPKAPLTMSERCVSMTFYLYEGDPGMTWSRSEGENGESRDVPPEKMTWRDAGP